MEKLIQLKTGWSLYRMYSIQKDSAVCPFVLLRHQKVTFLIEHNGTTLTIFKFPFNVQRIVKYSRTFLEGGHNSGWKSSVLIDSIYLLQMIVDR